MNYDSLEDKIIEILKDEINGVSIIAVPDDLDNYSFTHPSAEIYVGVRSGDYSEKTGLNFIENITISINIKARRRRGEGSLNDLVSKVRAILTASVGMPQIQAKNYEIGLDELSIWNAECYFTTEILQWIGEE